MVSTEVEKVTVKPRSRFVRPDTATGVTLKAAMARESLVATSPGKSLGGFHSSSSSLSVFGDPSVDSAVAPKLRQPASARKPVGIEETGKLEQVAEPLSARLATTVPTSTPASMPLRAETIASVANTDPAKPADKQGTPVSIVGFQASKVLPLEPSREASSLKLYEPASGTGVVRLKPAPPIHAIPATSVKTEPEAQPVLAERGPAAVAVGGLARQKPKIQTWPFRSVSPFATPEAQRLLSVFEPVSPQWLAEATSQAADNGRRKSTMPEQTVTPTKPAGPAPKATAESIAARQAKKLPAAICATSPRPSSDLALPEEAPLEKAVSSRHRVIRKPVVETVDFREVITPDGRASPIDERATSDVARPAVLEAEGPTPVARPETQWVRKQRPRIAATPVADEQVRLGQFEVIDHSDELTVVYRRSKLLRTNVDVYRTAVVDASICEVVQYTPREISVIGNGQGATHVTFWFEDGSFRPVTYLVRVVPDPEVHQRREEQFGLLEEHLAELFPESKVELLVLADKLIVKGQARDAEEAAQILALIRGQAVRGRDILFGGMAASPVTREETNRTIAPIQVINMLRIPGVQQVALRVKIAELNRSAARTIGVDLDLDFSQGELLVQSLINAATGGTASVLGSFDGGDLEFGLHYLEQHGVMRMLSEPTLVTLSGRPATFIAGGEFAVPTTVGVGGAAAVTTDFRAYGAIISFLPVVLDKDHIRLEVAPEFSQISDDNSVNGIPGLDTRAVTTTVEMREGQTLAIAGLLDESMDADKEGDLPWISQIFGRRNVTKNETELIILVTPELIYPMEPEAVPPLPGFDVTEPTNCEFYLKGHLEGRPTQEYRSTVWPRLRRRYQAGGPAMISGPFGHGD